MKLAVVGSRSFQNYEHLRQTLASQFPAATVIISGGAMGADFLARRYAAEYGLEMVEHRPDYDTHGGKVAPLIRNERIAEDCDAMVAFWDFKSRGTLHAAGCAKKRGKPVTIVSTEPSI